MRRVGLAVAVLLTLTACGADKKDGGAGAAGGGRAQKFKLFRYADRAGLGMDAFQVLIPEGWQFEGGITWVLDRPAFPASGDFRISGPRDGAQLTGFPALHFTFNNDPNQRMLFPVGSRYFGNEVAPPLEALPLLETVVIPRYRSGVTGLRIVKREPLPDLVKATVRQQQQEQQMLAAQGQWIAGTRSGATAGKVCVAYSLDGKPWEEEFYGIVTRFDVPLRGMLSVTVNNFWSCDVLFSLRAEQGKLESYRPLFQTMVSSFRMDPQWSAAYNQLVQTLARQQIQRIHNTGQISRMISRNSAEISDSMMASWQQRQEVYDRLSKDFSQNIRGVDEYALPDASTVELPAGYNAAWVNGQGEYIVTEQTGFNPNESLNGDWQRIERTP